MENRGEPTLITTQGALQATGVTDPSTKQVFIPQETLDEPFDLTLVVEDGKELKAHRRVLSKASTFFQKLLNSDMKESNEAVVRLEMLTVLGLRDLLEYIYTGNIQISADWDSAQDLFAMADYFDLPGLKILAGRVLVQELNASNSILTYCFAKRYQCEKLIRDTKDFIHSNFTAVAKTKEFLDLSSQEVKMFISSDEINVSAEEDVFEIILTWINHEKGDRKKHFAELFREVRLVYVSRGFVHDHIVTNDLVIDDEGCTDLVKDAMKVIDAENYHYLSVTPRSSLETPALIIRIRESVTQRDDILCYYPCEEKWSFRFRNTVLPNKTGEVLSCLGKFYFISRRSPTLLRYELFSNSWVPLPIEERKKLLQAFVAQNEIYALVSDRSCPDCISLQHKIDEIGVPACANFKRHPCFITKYKPASNSWEGMISFDLGWSEGICIVAKDNFIYFLGGSIFNLSDRRFMPITDAGKYDLNTNTWDKIADLQQPRMFAYGTVAYGKIFIADYSRATTCEMYNQLTNEWQCIPTPSERPTLSFMCGNEKVYALGDWSLPFGDGIKCYDPDSNSWINITQKPNVLSMACLSLKKCAISICSIRVLNRATSSKNLWTAKAWTNVLFTEATPTRKPVHRLPKYSAK